VIADKVINIDVEKIVPKKEGLAKPAWGDGKGRWQGAGKGSWKGHGKGAWKGQWGSAKGSWGYEGGSPHTGTEYGGGAPKGGKAPDSVKNTHVDGVTWQPSDGTKKRCMAYHLRGCRSCDKGKGKKPCAFSKICPVDGCNQEHRMRDHHPDVIARMNA
jgi:hypothetical protein